MGGAGGRFPHHPGTGSPKDLGTKILVPRSWYQDLGTKILVSRSLVPRSGYQDLGTKKIGELERRSLSKIERGSPPGTAGGLGGGSPPVKTILWTQNHLPTTFNHFQPSANHLRPPSYHLRPPTDHLHQALQTIIIFREKGETCTPPLGQGFRTAWLITGQKFL